MKLSIIIPTLNEEDYLPWLLESIKKQDFTDYEIIIADGGSEDKTIEIAKNCGCRIVSGGLPAKGRNEGAKIAKGEIFFFIDADSTLPDRFFSQLIKEFEKRELDIASFPVYPVRKFSISNGVYPQGNAIDKICYGIYNFWAWISQKFLPHATQTVLVKREIHKIIGGFDKDIKIGEDHAYARAGAKFGKFGFLKKVPPILTSARRFEREGRLKTYLIYILAGIWIFFFGKFKSDIFKYYSSRKRLKN